MFFKKEKNVLNKQDSSEANNQTESLADLPLTAEQADEAKAGQAYARHEGAFMGNLFSATPAG